jgi:hypothetical protein
MDVQFHSLKTTSLDGDDKSASWPYRFASSKRLWNPMTTKLIWLQSLCEGFREGKHIISGIELWCFGSTWNCLVTIPTKASLILCISIWELEGSRRLRLPDFKTVGTRRWQVCQPYSPAPLPRIKYSWYSFLLQSDSSRPEELCLWRSSMVQSESNSLYFGL